jgi:hypothetical protein
MGIWKNVRAGAAFMREYQQAAMETLPRWARVVRVGRRAFGMVSVDAEVHYGRTPPHVEPVSVSVPRGMQLQVGQDVFVVGPDTSSDSNDTTWILDVTRPPQYGSWPTPPEFRLTAPCRSWEFSPFSDAQRWRRAVIRSVRYSSGSTSRSDRFRQPGPCLPSLAVPRRDGWSGR